MLTLPNRLDANMMGLYDDAYEDVVGKRQVEVGVDEDKVAVSCWAYVCGYAPLEYKAATTS